MPSGYLSLRLLRLNSACGTPAAASQVWERPDYMPMEPSWVLGVLEIVIAVAHTCCLLVLDGSLFAIAVIAVPIWRK